MFVLLQETAGTRGRGGLEQPPSLLFPTSLVASCLGLGKMPPVVKTPLREPVGNA